MAVYSMTGYATASTGRDVRAEDGASSAEPAARVGVEIRSVNGRFLDLGLKLPDELRSTEPALRDLLTGAFRRGKVELRVQTGLDAAPDMPQPDMDRLQRLARAESTVRMWFAQAPGLSVHEVLQWCRGSSAPQRGIEALVLQAARAAVDGLRDARAREGERLVAVLRDRLQALAALAAQAEPLVPVAIVRQQQRFAERWQQAWAQAGGNPAVDEGARQERALNEAAAYAVRIDIAEELARLRAHLDEMTRLLDRGGEVGKRLDFLTQELLREANTLGSKAPSIELTGIAVEMKVAIEQVREQVQNVE